MGKAIISQADKSDDTSIKGAFDKAKTWLSGIGQSTASSPDLKKIREAMDKAKKPVCYQATLSADLKSLELQATVAGKVIEDVTSINLDALGQEKWRSALDTLKKDRLLTDGELRTWDAKHPDPKKVADLQTKASNLEKELTVLNMQIKRLQDAAKPKAEALLNIKKELKALGN